MKLELRPHQEEFVFSDRKYVCLDGGMGNGKSTAGILKLGIHCLNNPGTRVGLFREDFVDIRDSTLGDWMEMFGEFGTYHGRNHTFTFDQGDSVVLFKQLSAKDKLKNMNLSAALIEQGEETVSESFDLLMTRLRRQDVDNSSIVVKEEGGTKEQSMADRWLGVLSNPEGHDWIWQYFIQRDLADLTGPKADVMADVGVEPPTEEDFHYISASTFENMDNLSEDYLASLANLPDHLFKRYVEGSRDSFEGQIYSSLDPTVHYIEPFEVPKDWPKWIAIDHGTTSPTACLWFTMDTNQNIVVYREHYKAQGDDGLEWLISQHVDRIKDRQLSTTDQICPYEEKYRSRYCDPAMFSKTRERGKRKVSVVDEYRDKGLTGLKGWPNAHDTDDKLAQINRVSEHLVVLEDRDHITKKSAPGTQLYIMRNCPNTWEEMTQYRWKEQARQMADDQRFQEKPRKYKDHTVNCIEGYVAQKNTVAESKKGPPPGSFEDIRRTMLRRKRDQTGPFARY